MISLSESILFATRRKRLCENIRKSFPVQEGVVFLSANFEHDAESFLQESSFYYFTGIKEPGCMVLIDLTGESTLYIPTFKESRSQWVSDSIEPTQEHAERFGFQKIRPLGQPGRGYALYPFSSSNHFQNILEELSKIIQDQKTIFTLNPSESDRAYVQQRLNLMRFEVFLPELRDQLIDISSEVASLRRSKDIKEIEALHYALDVTQMAHEAAAASLEDSVLESEVQASLEYIITAAGGRVAYPSIVAGGKNATVLHYTNNNSALRSGDLVVVDIGARMNGYCADITRTYPISGTFTARQKELYEIVLEVQTFIADNAAPGMWLSNADQPEKSLNHMARRLLKEKGYDRYFPHGIGHFLGLDVHDVGDGKIPLQEGDVITIEPGIYIPEEGIGIRIEDNYWIVNNGAVCLSENILKSVRDVERLVQDGITAQAEFVESDSSFQEIDEDTEH